MSYRYYVLYHYVVEIEYEYYVIDMQLSYFLKEKQICQKTIHFLFARISRLKKTLKSVNNVSGNQYETGVSVKTKF